MRALPAALALALLLAGATARAQYVGHLLPAGDVDGDDRSDVLWVTFSRVSLWLGKALDGPPRWDLEVASGAVVAMAGDVDGDGLADVAIGEPEHDDGVGRVRIVLGDADTSIDERIITLFGERPGDRFGAALAAVNFDGDARSELLIGAPGRPPGGWVGVFTADAPEVAPLDEGLLEGATALGARLERVWDLNGDGYGDALVGDGAGAWLLGGSPDGPTVITFEADASALTAVGDRDGDGRADLSWWLGADPTSQRSGEVVVAAGDLDGDLVADVLIRANHSARAVSGARPGVPRRRLDSGVDLDSNFAPIGDVDGDGFADLGRPDFGGVVVWHGHGTVFGEVVAQWRAPPDPSTGAPPGRIALAAAVTLANDRFGSDGDYDGRDELVVGLPVLGTVGAAEAGEVAYLWGSDAPVSAAAPGPAWSLLSWVAPAFRAAGGHAGQTVAFGLMGERGGAVALGMPGLDVAPTAPDQAGTATLTDAGATLVLLRGDGDRFATGAAAGERRGSALAFVGDVDGDGRGDLVEVAPGVKEGPGAALVGEARLYLRPGLAPSLDPPQWYRYGDTPGGPLSVVAAAGDINGDTYADFALGAPKANYVDLCLGAPGVGPKLCQRLTPTAPNPGPNASFGEAIVAAGDLDGDGFGDLAVGAPGAGAGYVEVFYGGLGGVGARRTLVHGSLPGERFGAVLAAPGDVDGDGFADLVVASPERAGTAGPAVGQVALYRGGPTGLDPLPAWRRAGERANMRLGLALASSLDWNGDHFGDLAIGARDDDGRPFVIVVAGNDGMRGHTSRAWASSPNFPGPLLPWATGHARGAVDLVSVPLSPFAGAVVQEGEVTPTLGGPTRRQRRRTVASPHGQSHVMIAGLEPGTPHAFRVRARFPPADAPLQSVSRWRLGGIPGQPARVHFRTREDRAPLARADRYRVTSGSLTVRAAGLLSNDFDPDGDPIVVTGVSRGTEVVPSDDPVFAWKPDGSFVYTPASGRLDPVTYTYRASDGREVSEWTAVSFVLRPCDAAECRDGQFAANVLLPFGGRGSVRCFVRYDVAPPKIDCERDDQGALAILPEACSEAGR